MPCYSAWRQRFFAGIFIHGNINLLVYVAFMLVYYLLLFRLCLYRDPGFIYMIDEQLRVYTRKTMWRFNIYALIQLSVGFAVANIIGDKFHNADINWEIILINTCFIILVRTVYFSFKG
jgi:hypothetical protein